MEEIRAQKGVPMALMNGSGYPTEWDGTTLRNLEGEGRLRTVAEWKQGKYRLYTRPEGIRVLPPLDDEPSEPAIEVGSQWRRKSDGRQCVVVSAKGSPVGNYDPQIRFEDSAAPERIDHERLRSDFTHIVTPKPDRLVDGQKLVCMEAGEAQPKKRFDDGVRAVTVEHDGQTFIVFYIDNGYGGGLHAIRKDWE